MFDDQFLRLLRCPATHGSLRTAEQELVDRMNAAIERGELQNRLGQQVDGPLDSGLVNADGSLFYPVRHEIPTLIADEAIELDPSASET